MLNRDRHDPREPNDRPPVVPHAALEDVGDFNYDTDAYATALEYYQSALRSLGVETEFDPTTAARLHRKIADCYRSKGLLEDALSGLERARELLRGSESEVEWGVVLGRRADVLCSQGKHDEALQEAGLALGALKPTAAHREYAFALKVAANCNFRLGNVSEFEQLNMDALAAYRRIEDAEGIADVHNNLGLAYKTACQWDKAIRSLTKAKELGEQLGLTRRVARTLGNLGIVYTKTRDFHEAIAHLRRARKLVAQLGDSPSLVSVLNSLGRALTLTGRYAHAEKYLLEARVLAERHQLARSQAIADEFLGDLMLAQGRLAEARENYESGLRKARVIAPSGDVVGEILRRIAELELRNGLRSQALATAKRALRVCQGCGEQHEIGFIHRTLGLALAGLGKPREAAASFAASQAAFETARNPYEGAWTRVEMARLHLQEGGREALLRAVRDAGVAVEVFRGLEEDLGACTAGLLVARAHQALGNLDDGLLALCDVERASEENPLLGLADEVQALHRELERTLSAQADGDAGPMRLFHELYALAGAAERFEPGLQGVLESLRARTRAGAAFVALRLPGRSEPRLVARTGIDAEEALHLARAVQPEQSAPLVFMHVDGKLASEFPALAQRAGAVLCQPLAVDQQLLGMLYLERPRSERRAPFSQEDIDFVATYAGLASVLLHDNFREEYDVPGPQPGREDVHPALQRILTTDPGMYRILALAQKVASSTCTVLISGETGTGKGLLAHCIHLMSERRNRRFIALNCAALPEPLLESELFGHVRGAFTGADAEKMGLLEAGNGGTVFLDEVGKMSLFMQGKLLQFLDSSEVRPVGANVFKKVDVRMVCATKGSLRDLVEQGLLLEDLYFRLNDFPIVIPPLRGPPRRHPALVEHALRQYTAEMQKNVPGFSARRCRSSRLRMAGERPRAGEVRQARADPGRRPSTRSPPATCPTR